MACAKMMRTMVANLLLYRLARVVSALVEVRSVWAVPISQHLGLESLGFGGFALARRPMRSRTDGGAWVMTTLRVGVAHDASRPRLP